MTWRIVTIGPNGATHSTHQRSAPDEQIIVDRMEDICEEVLTLVKAVVATALGPTGGPEALRPTRYDGEGTPITGLRVTLRSGMVVSAVWHRNAYSDIWHYYGIEDHETNFEVGAWPVGYGPEMDDTRWVTDLTEDQDDDVAGFVTLEQLSDILKKLENER